MSKTIQTVTDLNKEWFDGIDGNESVLIRNSKYGAAWRSEDKDRAFYCRRKKIIDFIELKVAETGKDRKVVAQALESWRTRNGKTLDWMGKRKDLSADIGSLF
jgi:hypothetical protein